MNKFSLAVLTAVFSLSFLSFSSPVHAATWPTAATVTDIGSAAMATKSTFEPSGIVWHAGRGTYIVVGDGGDVMELSATGTVVNAWNPGGNWEDVTVADTTSTIIYLAHENNSAIYAFDLATGALTGSTWSVASYIYPVGKLGLEALTFVPDGSHAYGTTTSGGVFYAGWQYDADMYVFDVDTSTSGSITYLDQIRTTSGMSDLSGLSFNAATGTIFAVYDGYDLVEERATDGTLVSSSTMPAGSWEGITLNDSCPTSRTGTVALANDAGGITAYGSYPAACLVVDADGDGTYSDVDCNDADATVATVQTYFRDTDRDGYGDAADTTSLCSAKAPYGYVANDDDKYPKNKIELYGDGVDNDGDASIDENNTLGENWLHPTYGVMNAATTTGVATFVEVSKTGGFVVAYPDGSRYEYNFGSVAVVLQLKAVAGTSTYTATVKGMTYTANALTGGMTIVRTSTPTASGITATAPKAFKLK